MKKLLLNNGAGFNLDLGLLLIRVMLGVLMAFYGLKFEAKQFEMSKRGAATAAVILRATQSCDRGKRGI